MSIFYLYIKTHTVTGIKYLGKTKNDPYKYKGSGIRWNHILKKYGTDMTTEVLLITDSEEVLKRAGAYYSRLYNVVEDDNWANLMEEKGDGGDTSASPNFKASLKTRNNNWSEERKNKVGASIKKVWEDKFNDPKFDKAAFSKMCSERAKKGWANKVVTEEQREAYSQRTKEQMTPEAKENISVKAKARWQKVGPTYEVTFPDGHKEEIKCLRGWCKENGHPYYKLYSTIRGNRPSPKEGWMVKIIG